jgi:hypothetical protein
MTNTVDAKIFKVEVFESQSDYIHGESVSIDKIFVPSMDIVFWTFKSKIMCFKTSEDQIKHEITEFTLIQIPKHCIENILELIEIDVRRKNIEIGVHDIIKNYAHNCS